MELESDSWRTIEPADKINTCRYVFPNEGLSDQAPSPYNYRRLLQDSNPAFSEDLDKKNRLQPQLIESRTNDF